MKRTAQAAMDQTARMALGVARRAAMAHRRAFRRLEFGAGLARETSGSKTVYNLWLGGVDDWPVMNNGFIVATFPSIGEGVETLRGLQRYGARITYYGVVSEWSEFNKPVAL